MSYLSVMNEAKGIFEAGSLSIELQELIKVKKLGG